MQRTTVLLVLIMYATLAHAAGISGKVTDEKGEPLSYASVYIKGTTSGVTTNIEGKYSLTLQSGNYQIIFSYVGYTTQIKSVTIGSDAIVLNIQLQPDEVELKEVVVNADGEDPAYPVIRAAIKKRPYYLNQVEEYACKVYIKGVEKLDSIPKRIVGLNAEKLGLDSTMLGIVYLSESESEYNFKQADHVREIMVSSKVSGDNQAFSWNQASDFDFNFYRNLLNAGELSDRGFVSPISETAMLFYKYHLVGTFIENNELVNKIQVIPRRRSDPVFSGFIYIVEDSWRIHSTDLSLSKDAKIDFVDSLKILQTYAHVNDTVNMPFNQTFLFTFRAVGIHGNGYFVGMFNNYNVNPGFPKKFFKGEELKVNDDANKRDSVYWEVNRPVPLTAEEISDYRKKDSLEKLQNTKSYSDSVDRKHNKFGFSDLITGYNHYRSFTKTSYGFRGLLPFINYNTVEGWAPTLSFYHGKSWEDNRRYSANLKLHYGISNHLFSPSLQFAYLFNPVRFSEVRFNIGQSIRQFNHNNPIDPMVNTINTLFYETNYMKVYEEESIAASLQTELFNGFMITPKISYARNLPLENTAFKTFVDYDLRSFTSNYPFSDSSTSNFAPYNSFLFNLETEIHFKQKYYTRPNYKYITGSKFPALFLRVAQGIPTLNSDVNFTKGEAEITDKMKFGLFGHSEYSIVGGYFFNRDKVGIVEMNHFNGNQTNAVLEYKIRRFDQLPYYQFSTVHYYAEAHFEHHFDGFFLNKIPLVKKLNWKEVGGVHYLYTPDVQYAELSVGVEHVFKLLRIEWVTSYSNAAKLQSGFLVGIDVNSIVTVQ